MDTNLEASVRIEDEIKDYLFGFAEEKVQEVLDLVGHNDIPCEVKFENAIQLNSLKEALCDFSH